MPLGANDFRFLSSANMPEDDTSTSGGAVQLDVLMDDFNGVGGGDTVALVSDGGDARVVTVKGRSTAGAVLSENVTLSATTEVVTVNTFSRVFSVRAATVSPTRTITARNGPGGSIMAQIPPGYLEVRANFIGSFAEAATAVRFEKAFYRNDHATLALHAAVLTLTQDPLARIRFGVPSAKNDAGSVANRKTAPGGITFVDDNVDQNVPGGFLGPTESIGVWIEQTLPVGEPPRWYQAPTFAYYTVQLKGRST